MGLDRMGGRGIRSLLAFLEGGGSRVWDGGKLEGWFYSCRLLFLLEGGVVSLFWRGEEPAVLSLLYSLLELHTISYVASVSC